MTCAAARVASVAVTEPEEALLRDLNNTPISPITERYARLGWNPKSGNTAKDALLQKRLAMFEAITTPTGIVKILSLMDSGRAYLISKGVAVSRSRHGGAEHEYWKWRVKRHLERCGYSVQEEFAIGGGRTIDLHAIRGEEEVWIEVETGRSDVRANIEKLRTSNGRKVLVCTRKLEISPEPGFEMLSVAELRRL